MSVKRCRHDRNSWILGGVWEWCYRCGAIRRLDRVPGTTNGLYPLTVWLRPVGPDGENPGHLPERRRR